MSWCAVRPQCNEGYGKVDRIQYSPLISTELSTFSRSPVPGSRAHPRRKGGLVHVLSDVIEDVRAQNWGACFDFDGTRILGHIRDRYLEGVVISGAIRWLFNLGHEPASELGQLS